MDDCNDVDDEDTNFSIFFPCDNINQIQCQLQNKQRQSAYLGETVDLFLVASYRGKISQSGDEAEGDDGAILTWAWGNKVKSFNTGVSVCGTEHDRINESQSFHLDLEEDLSTEPDKSKLGVNEFRVCDPIANNKRVKKIDDGDIVNFVKSTCSGEPIVVDSRTICFPITVTMDSLAITCTKATVTCWVWSSRTEHPEHKTIGYLEAFMKYGREEVLRFQGKMISQRISSSMDILEPPCLKCCYFSIGGKHFYSMKVKNSIGTKMVIENIQVFPNYNDAFLPPRPDEDTESCDTSIMQASNQGDEKMHSNLVTPLGSQNSSYPVTLGCSEEYSAIFKICIKNQSEVEKLLEEEMNFLGLLTWERCFPEKSHPIISHYRLPSIIVQKPAFTLTAQCSTEDSIKIGKSFTVKYTINNNLHDFLSIKLLWKPEKALADKQCKTETQRRNIMNVINNVVCQDPSQQLGACKMGSTVTLTVGFQQLKCGLYELCQHMRLNLQYAINNVTSNTVAALSTEQRKGSTSSLKSLLSLKKPLLLSRSNSQDDESKLKSITTSSTASTPSPSRSPSTNQLLQNLAAFGQRADPPTSLSISAKQVLKRPFEVYVI